MTKKKKPRKRTKKPRAKFPLDAIDHMMLNHLVENPAYTSAQLGKLVGLQARAVKMRWVREEFREELRELSRPAREILERAAAKGAKELERQIGYKPKNFKTESEHSKAVLDIRGARVRQIASLGVVRTVVGDKQVHEGEIKTDVGLPTDDIVRIGKQVLKEIREGE